MTFKNLILGEVRVDFIFKFLSFVFRVLYPFIVCFYSLFKNTVYIPLFNFSCSRFRKLLKNEFIYCF